MGRRVRRRQDDHGTARSAHPSLPYPGDWQRQLPLQGERCSTQNTEGKTRHLTVPASRETIVQPGQFSMTIPGQFLATINTLLPKLECRPRSEEHTSELQSRPHLVCRLLLE